MHPGIPFVSKYFSFFLLAGLIAGCAGTRALKEGETFYGGSEIKFTNERKAGGERNVSRRLKEYFSPKPNTTILGSRPGVWFYHIAGTPKKQKGLRHFLKTKLGNEPVLLSDATPEETSSLMENELKNEGYFGSTVRHEIKTKGKKSILVYTVELHPAFRFRNVHYNVLDSADSVLVEKIQRNALLRINQRYRLERIQDEQKRLEEVAKNSGYFYFDDRFLLFEADSTVGNRKIDGEMIMEEGTPIRTRSVYRLGDISIVPDYNLRDSVSRRDTTQVQGFQYVDGKKAFRPQVITRVVNLHPDSIYRKIDHEYTISRLMSLKTFKFVSADFTPHPSDSLKLDVNLRLTPLPKKSIRLQAQGVSKSNNFVGPGLEVTFTNRNFLRGAEQFQFKLSAAYESQISRQQTGALNAVELGLESSLSVPRFITPFPLHYRSAKYVPQTQVRAGYNFQQRLQYFRLATFNVGYGYLWRETTLKTHELFPIDVNFVRSSKTSGEFNELLERNPALASSFQNQFIPGLRYTFTLNTQLQEDMEREFRRRNRTKSNFYFQGTVGLAGNLLRLLQSGGKDSDSPYELFGSAYSQYVKGEVDFRYYLRLDRHQKLATRISVGTGYAYGNSTHLPYIKQFAVGGSNSIRAFPARSVGPGTYNVRSDPNFSSVLFLDQRADIKLEGSLEYRFDVVKALKGALFVDAGNIWLIREDTNRPGGTFNSQTFMKELAVGTGFGLRYDFNFVVLRVDLAFPVRKPYLPLSERWVFDEINPGSSSWRRENLILNIAIGYPF